MSRREVLAILAVAVAAVVGLALVDSGPNVAVVITIVVAVGAATSFLRRTTGDLAPPPPVLEPLDEPTAPPDLRTTTLRQALAAGNTSEQVAERVYRQLVAVVDDELWRTHGIDRAASPEASRAVLPPHLHRFVSDPESGRRMNVRSLERIVTQIERL